MNLNLSSMRDSFCLLRALSLPSLETVSFIMERWGTRHPVLPLTPNSIKDIARLLATARALRTVHFDFYRNVYDTRMRVPYDELRAVLLAAGCRASGFYVAGARRAPSWDAPLADEVDEYDLGPLLDCGTCGRTVVLRVNVGIDDVSGQTSRKIMTMMFLVRTVTVSSDHLD